MFLGLAAAQLVGVVQIHQDCAIAMPFANCPIINAEHAVSPPRITDFDECRNIVST